MAMIVHCTQRHFEHTLGYPGEGPRSFCIANVTGKGNITTFVQRHQSWASVFLLQETKHIQEDVDSLFHTFSMQGYYACHCPAKVTEKQGRSGGVMILWRKFLQVQATTTPVTMENIQGERPPL
jgi:exonuclease III